MNIVDVIETKVDLKPAGSTYVGRCPFHADSVPSFVVYPENQTYRCFGCNKSGDVFTFVMESERVDFQGAVNWLEYFRQLHHLASLD